MSRHNSQSPRILIVSETLANSELLEKSLADEEYRIGNVCNLRVALKTVPSAQPDLVLLDLSDSHLNVYEVCRRLKSDCETVRILVVTSLNQIGDLEKAVTAGCDDFLTRPVNEQELRTRVRSLLRVKRD